MGIPLCHNRLQGYPFHHIMQKVLLVGCGFMGKMHASAYAKLDSVTMAGFVDCRIERAEAFAKEYGGGAFTTLSEALAATDCTMVDICLPTDLHAEFTCEAARAGKHVLCEKPMALNLADGQRMADACKAAGVELFIGHCIRYWPEYAYLKKLVDSGELGQLQHINLTRCGEFPHWSSDNWLADPNRSGGGALDMRIHDTDFVLYLLGTPDEAVSHGHMDERGVGISVTLMRFGRTSAVLDGGWSWHPGVPFRMSFRALFERGSVWFEGGPLTVYPATGEPYTPEFEVMKAEGGGNLSDLGGYFLEIKDFVEHLERGESTTIVTPQTSLRSLEVCLEEVRQISKAYAP